MTRFSHLFVHVTDLATTRTFYIDHLGLEVLMEEPGYIRVGGGDGFHIGIEQAPEQVGGEGIEIVIAVDDVDAAFRRLRTAGVEFDSEPAEMPWAHATRGCATRPATG